MSVVIDSGTARNAANTTNGTQLAADPTEKRFVTYVNDLGAVHTIIVDVEHIAKDAESLVKWFDHTRATVTHKSGTQEQSNHITPSEVLKLADEFLHSIGGAKQPDDQQQQQQNTGGA